MEPLNARLAALAALAALATSAVLISTTTPEAIAAGPDDRVSVIDEGTDLGRYPRCTSVEGRSCNTSAIKVCELAPGEIAICDCVGGEWACL